MAGHWRHYLQVTKPGIVAGNLVSTVGGYYLGMRGSGGGVGLVCLSAGTGLLVASGCVVNNCLDRHADRLMARTRRRALAAGRMGVRQAGVYAAVLGIIGMVLAAAASPVGALCLGAGWVAYVLFYTAWLKPVSSRAALIGGFAGAAPPVAGYCAAVNGFDAGAAVVAAIFFFWQLPHFYAIAIYRLDEYRAAGIPVLPVRHGTKTASIHCIVFAAAFLGAALLLGAWGYAGTHYQGLVGAMCLLWIWSLAALWRGPDVRRAARRVFVVSVASMCMVSVMMAVDARPPEAPRALRLEPSPSGNGTQVYTAAPQTGASAAQRRDYRVTAFAGP